MSNEKKNGAKSKKKNNEVIATSARELPCTITQTEVVKKSDEIAKLHAEVAELRVKKKQVSDELGLEVKGKESSIAALIRQIRTRTEHRDVPCEEIADYRNDTVITRRTDTGKTVGSRPMTPNERQPGLFPIAGGKDAKPGKATKKKDAETAQETPATA